MKSIFVAKKIDCLLRFILNPDKRISAKRALEHPYFADHSYAY